MFREPPAPRKELKSAENQRIFLLYIFWYSLLSFTHQRPGRFSFLCQVPQVGLAWMDNKKRVSSHEPLVLCRKARKLFFFTSKCYLKSIFTFTFKNKLQLPNFENFNLYLITYFSLWKIRLSIKKQFPNCDAKVTPFPISSNTWLQFLMFYNIVLNLQPLLYTYKHFFSPQRAVANRHERRYLCTRLWRWLERKLRKCKYASNAMK